MHSACSFGVPITDTNTLACCKSPATSARVTVTFLTRGSRNSNRIVSLATSRMTSETRARRCCFMLGPISAKPQAAKDRKRLNFHFVGDQFRHGMAAQGLHDLAQRRFQMVRFVAHHRHAQDRQLAVVELLHLRNRNVEMVV